MSGLRVVLASGNDHKVEELDRILRAVGADVDVVGADEVGGMPDVAETGATFAENALLKARALWEETGLPCLADDSGLCVDALNGMPGVLSARWSGQRGPRAEVDAANTALLLAQTADVPTGRRGAAFVAALALVRADGSEVVEQGEVRGHLLSAPRGAGGFGYDPVFVPDGHDVSSAELTPEQKDAVSHRGAAVRAMAAHLPTRS